MLTHRDYVETMQRICKDYVETMYLSSHHSKLGINQQQKESAILSIRQSVYKPPNP